MKVLQWRYDNSQGLLRTEKEARGSIYWLEIIPKSTKLHYVNVNTAYLRADDSQERCSGWRLAGLKCRAVEELGLEEVKINIVIRIGDEAGASKEFHKLK